MTKNLLNDVASAMEAPVCLLPHLQYLLQDLPSLSGAENEVVEVLREVGLPSGSRVLDLGCGRGDIATRVARAFHAEVTGVDGYPPFIKAARQSAKKEGLERVCKFVVADLRELLAKPADFDAVLLIAVGPVLGDQAETVGKLRTVVRDGGWIIIDDAYLENGEPPSVDYEDYLDLDTTEAMLTQFGDSIVARRVRSPAGRSFSALALEAIPVRAKELIELQPELEETVNLYVARQLEEFALMEGPVVPALWVIQKSIS